MTLLKGFVLRSLSLGLGGCGLSWCVDGAVVVQLPREEGSIVESLVHLQCGLSGRPGSCYGATPVRVCMCDV